MFMFDDTIFEKLLDSLKVNDRVVVTSHLFYEFKTNEERVALAYQLLEEENLLPNCSSVSSRKSLEDSTCFRNQGNIAFQKRKDFLALHLYNQSLASAPLNSKEYALALGNRSAVNLALGFHEACLCDIESALNNGYPLELQLKLFERRLKCYIHLGKKPEAEQAMEAFRMESMKTSCEGLNFESTLRIINKDFENLMTETNKSDLIEKPSLLRSSFGCLDTPPLSSGQNSEIPCASDSLSLKYSEIQGRHLVAAQDISPGDVLIVEQPFASVLLPEARWTHCYHCLCYCLSPIPCLHCSEVLFCNEKCRTISWAEYHSVDCCLMPILIQSVGKMGLLALRVLIIASSKGTMLLKLFDKINKLPAGSDPRTLGFNKKGQYVSSEYWPINFLVGHTSRRAVADLFRRSVTAACLLHCLKVKTEFFSSDVDEDVQFFAGGLLLQYLQSLPCNAHEVSQMNVKAQTFDSREIGAAAYATLSLLNHSCDPNVVRHSYSDWAVLRAIRPIRVGEEILDNYGYHHALHDLDQRRTQLSKQYFFHCMCEACKNCWPLYKYQPTQDPVYCCSFCGEGFPKVCDLQVNMQCVKCKHDTDIQNLKVVLDQSSKSFRDHLSNVLAGHHKDNILQSLFKHLQLLSKTIKRPWREFSECQEAIKQCLSLQSNHLVVDT